MTELMIRTLVIGGLATLAALLFERGLAHLRMGTRFAWTFALLATLVLPWLPRFFSSPVADVVPQLTAPAIVITATSGLASRMPFDVLRIIAIMLSVGVALFYAVAFVRLLSAQRRWRASRIADHDVYLSNEFGPAVFGFTKPRIVVPEWVQTTSTEEQQLIVLHEREHIAARDQLQLLLTILATVVMPWNPFVWLQARALRFRVETDCDQRVLAALPDRARYAELLMDVGSKQNGLLLTPALAEHRNGLERRLTMLADRLIANRWKALGLMAAGLVLTVVACESRLPNEPTQPEPQAFKTRSGVLQSLPREGEASLLQLAPNAGELIEQYYPPLLREAGIGGVVTVRAIIDVSGNLTSKVSKSSGHKALDQAAVRVIGESLIVPVRIIDGVRTAPFSVDFMLAFDPQGNRRTMAPSRLPLKRQGSSSIDEAPKFTPFDVKPELANRDEVSRMLVRNYPPLLRDAGIGGTTIVWVLVDETGKVADARLKSSSGRVEIDEAAERVAAGMRFTPAQHQGKPTKVWIQLPIVFRAE